VEEMAICQRGWDSGVLGRNFNHCAGGRDKGARMKHKVQRIKDKG